MYQAVLFDMDGVLLNTEEMTYEIWRDFLCELESYHLPLEKFAKIAGSPPQVFNQFIAEALPGDPERLLAHWGKEMGERIFRGEIPTLPGYEMLMAFLEDYPGKKALVTSNGGEWADGYRRLFRFDEVLDGVFTGNLVERRKPAPDLYRLACRALGVEPSECLAVEDSFSGICAAQEAGISVLWMQGISAVPEDTQKSCVGTVRDLLEVKAYLEWELHRKRD